VSYARKGPESDVYVYRAALLSFAGEVFICHECQLDGALVDDDGHYVTRGPAARTAMVGHLVAHRDIGSKVPELALTRLIDDRPAGEGAGNE
jgi:hypothetical protein